MSLPYLHILLFGRVSVPSTNLRGAGVASNQLVVLPPRMSFGMIFLADSRSCKYDVSFFEPKAVPTICAPKMLQICRNGNKGRIGDSSARYPSSASFRTRRNGIMKEIHWKISTR
ncbi:hypothetical protein K503DRAFT_770087 [Rhizopogon vinicolor AM-OR11-026]|uniref:Uncharacterized protein n=1 Tax=Rhizopogon vinicolor AM-OR11-026 TaxID=1314800 RepID=A0A1B7N1X0_9AGAM|nr:hypothetical protein K503DRAFT_770087 [Rhizopogon vinicolor AM-OR11-026]